MAPQRSFCDMRLGRWVWVGLAVCALATGANAQDDREAISDIMKQSSRVLDEKEDVAGSDARLIMERDASVLDDGWQLPPVPEESVLKSEENSTAQQRAWNQFAEASKGMPREYVGAAPPRPKVPDNAMYVFISLSMPAASIRDYFLQALSESNTRPVIFVIRGWTPPDLQGLVSRLNELFPDANDLRALPNVQINPTMYQEAGVEVVPTFIQKDAAGVWRKLAGETSLAEASRRITNVVGLEAAVGPLYEIEEPDILKVMKERMATYDWDADVKRARENIYKRTGAIYVAHAEERFSYTVDLTVRANRNLEGAGGETFAYAGQAVNPFDHMTLRKRYLFFDANNDGHVGVVKAWVSSYPNSTLITTEAVQEEARREELLAEFQQPIHEANQLLVSRFKLRAVPAMAYQEGRLLRIDVEPAENE